MPIRAEAVVFPEPGRVELETIDVPDPGPDDVAVRTAYSGVSQGTERWMLNGRYNRMAENVAANYPCFPGYQAAGVVDAVGSNVSDLQPGDKVFLPGACLAGGAHKRGGSAGSAGQVSYLVAPRIAVSRLGAGADLAEASLYVMAAVGRHGVRLTDVHAGELVVVIGQGMIGQMSAQAARQRGARVIASDLVGMRAQYSAQYSANRAVDASRERIEEVVRSEASDGADVVIDTSGNSRLFEQSLALIRREGRICMQGYYPDPIVIDFHRTHLKRAVVAFPCGYDRERDQELADDISAQRLTIAPLITHRVPYREAPDAYRLIMEHPDRSLGMVLTWD